MLIVRGSTWILVICASGEMGRSFFRLILILAVLQLLCVSQGHTEAQTASATGGQKRVAVTIDDLPLNGPPLDLNRLRAMTDRILTAIRKHKVPTVGFVNESQLYVTGETDSRIAILKAWADAGVELGNHTYSHIGFKDSPLARFQDDFIRGDTVIGRLMGEKGQRVRYFRHPFLQMGPTVEAERSFENFIAERGYQIAPITIDSGDWLILSAYAKARKQGDRLLTRRISEEYLKFVNIKFAFAEKAAADLFARPINHILLLHANELNADNLDALLAMLKDRGYQFITLGEALKDPVYQYPEKYNPTSDWLLQWSLSRDKTYNPPTPSDFIMKLLQQNEN